MESIQKRAGERFNHIVFPETGDARVLKAVSWLAERKLCEVTLLGDKEEIRDHARGEGISLEGPVNIIQPGQYEGVDRLASLLYSRRQEKGMTMEEASEQVLNPLYFGGAFVASGLADGCVAGSIATTGEVIRAAIHTIGLREGNTLVSSIFLMELTDGRLLTYGDCGVVPYPDATQLSEIAVESARTHRLLTEEVPLVAMLSFSTQGSARHERVDLVREALEQAQRNYPDLNIDGEFQFDAAFVPEVARRKAPGSSIAGKANVFVFPNLDAGNIGYKITERIGDAIATGPILQGLDKPMMDLSRGCSWKDIANAACVASLMG